MKNNIPYQHLSVLIIPTDFCNMNCVYCFNGRRKEAEKKRMSSETLHKIFEITLPYYKDIRFIFHGGEPLLAGIPFYENVVRFQNELNTNNCKIKNSVQTNLSLMSKEYARFFVENDFHIGSSFDGTRNELTRHNTSGILRGYQTLKEAGGRCGFIYVTQKRNIGHLIEDYEWFKSRKINYTINIYLSDPDNPADPLVVSESDMVSALSALFDHWLYDSDSRLSILYFEHFVRYFFFKEKSICCYNSCLGRHVGIRYDGQIFCCNRDFPENMSYGNIYDYQDIHACFQSDGFNRMLQEAVVRRRHCRETCEIYNYCTGGCNSAALQSGSIEKNNSYVCNVLRGVYAHIHSTLSRISYEAPAEIQKLNPFMREIIRVSDKGGEVFRMHPVIRDVVVHMKSRDLRGQL